VLSNLTALTKLNIYCCKHVTSEGLQAVSNNLPALTELDLSFSDVTDQALEALRSTCEQPAAPSPHRCTAPASTST
jgi:hypothetical protein